MSGAGGQFVGRSNKDKDETDFVDSQLNRYNHTVLQIRNQRSSSIFVGLLWAVFDIVGSVRRLNQNKAYLNRGVSSHQPRGATSIPTTGLLVVGCIPRCTKHGVRLISGRVPCCADCIIWQNEGGRGRGQGFSRYLREFEMDCLVWCEVTLSILYLHILCR